MAGGGRAAAAGPREVDDLVVLATSRPWAALTRARAVLAGRPGPHDASVAHQAAGIVLQDDRVHVSNDEYTVDFLKHPAGN